MTYRNPKLLALARYAPKCFCCGADNIGNVVAAHCNSLRLGKGISFKAADLPAYLCHDCHDSYDGRAKGAIEHNDHPAWAWAMALSLKWAHETHPEVFQS